jgi:hypothetical protein
MAMCVVLILTWSQPDSVCFSSNSSVVAVQVAGGQVMRRGYAIIATTSILILWTIHSINLL